MADGTYYLIIQAAVTGDRGQCRSRVRARPLHVGRNHRRKFTVTTLNDTNGDAGLSDNNGVLNATVFVSGDTFSLAEGGPAIGSRIRSHGQHTPQDSIIGAWVAGSPARDDGSLVIVFDGTEADHLGMDGPGADDGIEDGTYQWNPARILGHDCGRHQRSGSGPGSVASPITQALSAVFEQAFPPTTQTRPQNHLTWPES